MIETLKSWYHRHFSDPQAVLLALLLVGGFAIIFTMGRILAPVLASLVLAYLLEGLVKTMTRRGSPRGVAVLLVYLLFLTVLLAILFVLMPLLTQQVTQFFQELPKMITAGRQLLLQLPERYPQFISTAQVDELILRIRVEAGVFGQRVVSISIASLPGVVALIVYLIIVPLLVFFFLKDKDRILLWLTGFLPPERSLPTRVWREMDEQIGNYVRGKVWEVLIVGGVTYATFTLMQLNYTPLLSVLVGLSVIIPYVGAAVVTIPVAAVAFFQWGWGDQFIWLMVAYGVIQALDGNVLVPLLFSEVVNLHPVAIIVAVLAFGGLWGFWGVFFAIPLATLIKVLLAAWPKRENEPANPPLNSELEG